MEMYTVGRMAIIKIVILGQIGISAIIRDFQAITEQCNFDRTDRKNLTE